MVNYDFNELWGHQNLSHFRVTENSYTIFETFQLKKNIYIYIYTCIYIYSRKNIYIYTCIYIYSRKNCFVQNLASEHFHVVR